MNPVTGCRPVQGESRICLTVTGIATPQAPRVKKMDESSVTFRKKIHALGRHLEFIFLSFNLVTENITCTKLSPILVSPYLKPQSHRVRSCLSIDLTLKLYAFAASGVNASLQKSHNRSINYVCAVDSYSSHP